MVCPVDIEALGVIERFAECAGLFIGAVVAATVSFHTDIVRHECSEGQRVNDKALQQK